MNFDESFYTDDFDQEMMDFIEDNFAITGLKEEWVKGEEFLKYGVGCNYFWTSYIKGGEYLTKQQFKEKIGMTTKQFTKLDLQDGDVCHTANNKKWYFINKKMYICAVGVKGAISHDLINFTDDLEYKPVKPFNITSVERKGKIIWTKPEDSRVKQEIESIRKQQEELAKRLKELEKSI